MIGKELAKKIVEDAERALQQSETVLIENKQTKASVMRANDGSTRYRYRGYVISRANLIEAWSNEKNVPRLKGF